MQPHPPTRPKVRAVVVTWQAVDLIAECLDSLVTQDVPGYDLEVVVVDNASTDGTMELLENEYPEVRVIRSEINVGFAGGVALGTAGFEGDVVVLLNNDAVFDDGAVALLVKELARPGNERVAAATAKILLTGRYRTSVLAHEVPPPVTAPWLLTSPLDPAGVTLVNSTGNLVRRDGSGADRDWLAPLGTESTDPRVFGFCGGAAALRWSAAASVGGFDASLFLYYEDTDLSWRLRAHGWTVRYVADAIARHRHAASSGAESPLFRYFNTRNSLVVVTRHGPWSMVAVSYARQTAGWLRSIRTAGWSAQPTRARGRALRDALAHAPGTLRERRRLWSAAPLSRRAALRAA